MKTKITTIAFLTIFMLLTTISLNAQTEASSKITFVKIAVDGLSCPFCAYGLEKKLKKIESVNDVKIVLEKGEATFSVSKNKQPTKEALQQIVKDAGFTPKEIVFSEKSLAENDE